jgi:hypothetical protein
MVQYLLLIALELSSQCGQMVKQLLLRDQIENKSKSTSAKKPH